MKLVKLTMKETYMYDMGAVVLVPDHIWDTFDGLLDAIERRSVSAEEVVDYLRERERVVVTL